MISATSWYQLVRILIHYVRINLLRQFEISARTSFCGSRRGAVDFGESSSHKNRSTSRLCILPVRHYVKMILGSQQQCIEGNTTWILWSVTVWFPPSSAFTVCHMCFKSVANHLPDPSSPPPRPIQICRLRVSDRQKTVLVLYLDALPY